MMKQVDVTEKVYVKLAVRAGAHRSISSEIERLLDLAERYEVDRKKLGEWIDSSEVKK